jgi:K+-sensing histidine kinase KdpD
MNSERHSFRRSLDVARNLGITLDLDPDLDRSDVDIVGDEALLVTALYALVEAGINLASQGTVLNLRRENAPEGVQILIEANGRTVPDAFLTNFFDLFSIKESSLGGVNLGLRPAVGQRILTLFGGGASVKNQGPGGICLTATFRTSDPVRTC